MTIPSQRITGETAAEHITAEAWIRGDLDETTVQELAEILIRECGTDTTLGQAANKIIEVKGVGSHLDERTCNALSSYLIRRSLGHNHDAIAVVVRTLTPASS